MRSRRARATARVCGAGVSLGERAPAEAHQGLSSGMAGRGSLRGETGSGGPKATAAEEPRVAFFSREFPGSVRYSPVPVEELAACGEPGFSICWSGMGRVSRSTWPGSRGSSRRRYAGALRGSDAARARDERPIRPGARRVRRDSASAFRGPRGAARESRVVPRRAAGDCRACPKGVGGVSRADEAADGGRARSVGGGAHGSVRRADARGRRARAVGPVVGGACAAAFARGMAG